MIASQIDCGVSRARDIIAGALASAAAHAHNDDSAVANRPGADPDQDDGGLFTFVDDDADHESAPLTVDRDVEVMDTFEVRNPRVAARILVDIASREQQKSNDGAAATDLTMKAPHLRPVLVPAAVADASCQLQLAQLHVPLGIGTHAVAFRGRLISSNGEQGVPVAVRVMMARLDSGRDVIRLVRSACRASAISEAAHHQHRSGDSCQEDETVNVLRSFGVHLYHNAELAPRCAFVLSLWELATGGTWQAHLHGLEQRRDGSQQQQPLSFSMMNAVRPQCEQVVRGVLALHRVGCVVRDAKPLNCFVVERGSALGSVVVVIGDLDSCLVWGLDGGEDEEESGDEPVGTVWFAAPELVWDPSLGFRSRKKGEEKRVASPSSSSFRIAARADSWSLAAMLLSIIYACLLHDSGDTADAFSAFIGVSFPFAAFQRGQQQHSALAAAVELTERLRAVGEKLTAGDAVTSSSLFDADFAQRCDKLAAVARAAVPPGIDAKLVAALLAGLQLAPAERIDVQEILAAF